MTINLGYWLKIRAVDGQCHDKAWEAERLPYTLENIE